MILISSSLARSSGENLSANAYIAVIEIVTDQLWKLPKGLVAICHSH